jgi:methane monooxygenase component C
MPPKHPIDLLTSDGEKLSFSCARHATVLDAAAEAGIHIPVMCRKGTCGLCRGQKREGVFNLIAPQWGLSPHENETGALLLCLVRPEGPMTVEVPSTKAHLLSPPPPVFFCDVASIEDLGGQVRRLVLTAAPDMNGRLNSTFDPGQYMDLEVPGTMGTYRAYSLTNTSNPTGTLEFFIRIQPGGLFSTWLADHAGPGDFLRARGPSGAFRLRTGSTAPRRLVAGGTGLAPMLSILRDMVERADTMDTHLFFGLTRQSELFGLPEIESLIAALPNLTAHVCIWEPDEDWTGLTGTPVDALRAQLTQDLAAGLSPDVYLCGPGGMVQAAQQLAAELGLPTEQVVSESFTPA